MVLTLTEDKKFFKLSNLESSLEYEQLKIILTKKVKNYRFIPAVKKGVWDGSISFIDAYNRIPSGLWKYVGETMNKNKFHVTYEGIENLFDDDLDFDEFTNFCETLFKDCPKKPRDYQIEGAFNVLKHRRCCSLMATNSGKTMVAFIVYAYLIYSKKAKHMLIIVPNVSLVVQASNDFLEYNEFNQVKLKIQQVYSGTEKNVGCNLTIGTYQSLVKQGQEYFNKFDAVIIDECLHPDTLVTMYNGEFKKVKDVTVGDIVKTVNDITKEVEHREVEYVYKNLSCGEKMYELKLENEDVIFITGNHKVKLINSTYKRVDELTLYDEVLSID